ncbi:glycosyltransferase [Arthrobacter sp. SLBN-53]|uniref:glycosyltransferase n=1 Tax=Arthrobacter sp. SLBN-53 TaxID=2768412 RepID=UPI001169406B|nr:glycosyltransferase [Arthrobacter sp. SLBN-53]TQK30174.1 glycosyltransferase involved in cell wall biosynthesis [Arthrobacter sp. SLBN-53]
MTVSRRIALIASNRHPIRQPFAGGLETHVWHLARALVQRGHHVSLFAGTGSDTGLACESLRVHEMTLSSAAQADVSMPAASFMADHHAYLSLMLDLARGDSEQYDIVHNHSLHHLPVAMAPMLSIPMLTTVHTPPTPWLESALAASKGEGSRIAAVSRHTAAAWRHVSEDIRVVPNGVDTTAWRLGTGGHELVWFGRITPEKGTHLAIAAARKAARPLLIAGPISDPRYYERAVEPELDGRIRHVGHLANAELVALVGAAAAVLVTPMWAEPYGLVVAESMSCGTPVVAFDRGGIGEMLDPRAGRLVPPGDVAAMAAAIPDAVDLPREQVRSHAVRCCSEDAMVRTYLSLYTDMLTTTGDADDDRLLRAPSGLRTPGAGDEYHRADDSTGHGTHQPRGAAGQPVHECDRASA